MINSSQKLPGRLDEFEATHSLEEVKNMARERGISPAGTKREIASRLRGHRAVGVAPQVLPDEYSWQFLERQPYGLAIWETALINGVRTAIFMAREPQAQMLRIQDNPDAVWKALSFGLDINGRRVMPIVVMILFVPLQTIYEVYFNFYGEAGEAVQEFFRLLGEQATNYLFFHDKGAEPVRKFGFANNLDQFFRGHYGMISAVPAWSDEDFNEAKRQLMNQYTGEQMWGLQ